MSISKSVFRQETERRIRDAMAKDSVTIAAEIGKVVSEAQPDVLRALLQKAIELMMSAEADVACGAEYGKRAQERVNHRNGYRSRIFDTRVGTMELAIPKLRQGSYYPAWLLNPRRRAERALVNVIAECYVMGVSTRKVEDIAQALGIEKLSKSQVSELAKSLDEEVTAFRNRSLEDGPYPYMWLDATIVKDREMGRVVNVAGIVATGVNKEGRKSILGFDVITSETEDGWLGFLRGLGERGLSGVQIVVSDAHRGLKKAIATALPGASWQRCRTHFMRNLLCKVPRKAQPAVATMVRSIFAQTDKEEVVRQYGYVIDRLSSQFPEAAGLLIEAEADLLAFMAFPTGHWRQLWSNNPQERLNREIKRRTDVVGIFPNREAIIRLVGAVLMEQNEEWLVCRRYMTLETLEEATKASPDLLVAA